MKASERALLGILVGACVSTGCASAGAVGPAGRTPPPGEELFYPGSEPRLQFLLTLSNLNDLRGDPGDGPSPGLAKPYGIALRDSVLHVCDTMLRGIQSFDFRNRALTQWRPQGAGHLETPVSCRIDRETGDLYVADPGGGKITVFDATQAHRGQIEFDEGRPTDAFVLGDTIWVPDAEGGRVYLYDKATRSRVRALVDRTVVTDSTNRLFRPTKVWVTEDEVYVTDFGDFRIKVYTRDGRFLRSVGSYGPAMGQFIRPKGLAVDRLRRLYVVDAGFDNVQIFNEEGALLLFFGGPTGELGGLNLPADIHLSYEEEDLALFRPYVASGYDLEYVVLVSSQYGQGLVNVYGFITPVEGAGDGGP